MSFIQIGKMTLNIESLFISWQGCSCCDELIGGIGLVTPILWRSVEAPHWAMDEWIDIYAINQYWETFLLRFNINKHSTALYFKMHHKSNKSFTSALFSGQCPAGCRGGEGDWVPGQLPGQAALGGGRGAWPPDQPQGPGQARGRGQEGIRGQGQGGDTGQPRLPPGEGGEQTLVLLLK